MANPRTTVVGPFGEVIKETGAASGLPFRFSTKYQDKETGLLYFGYRYYQTNIGMWLSRDPLQEAQGFNLYAFVKGVPVNRIDYLGLTGYLSSQFDVSMVPVLSKKRTQVDISFSVLRACGCKHPKLAQIVIDYEYSILGSLLDWPAWSLDTDSASWPWYPGQTLGPHYSIMQDFPGINKLNIFRLAGLAQAFETCAVCTDKGEGHYKVIGCTSWGQFIDVHPLSITTWGEGKNLPVAPPSANFFYLFPFWLLEPQG